MSDELPCPEMSGALEVGEKILASFGHLHSDAEAVRGMILLQRAITEEMHAVLPCRPSITQGGQLVCSLAAVINNLSALLFTPNIQASSAIQLDAVAKGQADERTTGMFL
jgi:hypothetical protein